MLTLVMFPIVSSSSISLHRLSSSLHIFFGNISLALLWQYIYVSSMAISLCPFFGHASASEYLHASASNIFSLLLRAISSLCFCEQYLLFASTSNIFSLLLQAISSLCFYEQCLLFAFAAASEYLHASASNIFSLLLRAISSLCFCEQYLLFASTCNVFSLLLLLRAILFFLFHQT